MTLSSAVSLAQVGTESCGFESDSDHNLLSSLIQRARLLVQISDIFQLCHAMDKLFCVKTVLLKLIEVGMADVCIMHVQIIHP